MTKRRVIEIFTAGCVCCDDAVALVEELTCPSCDVRTLDMRDGEVTGRARELGVRSVPAVAVDGRLAACCAGRGVNSEQLRAAGIGTPLG